MRTNRILWLVIGCIWITSVASAQTNEIFVPLEIQKAIKKGTRTMTGFPGPNYFQNKADYKIKTSFDPKTGMLKGEETILYFNNSHDTLRTILFNIYQDLFKKGNVRAMRVDPVDVTDGVIIDKLVANGITYADSLWRRNATFLTIRPKTSILPGTTTRFELSWQLHIPVKTRLRMGTYDTTSFFIAYWYPQIAVYDDIDGWDKNPHLGQQEFYREYAHFEVEITIPQNFVVWATGLLQNKSELFTDEINNRLASSEKSDTTWHIVTDDMLKAGSIFRLAGSHTFKFSADNVLDFAFGTSDHYLWDACSGILNPQTGQRINTYAAYRKQSNFGKAAGIAAKSIQLLSHELYDVIFPYPVLTVFDGGPGGMEFPMIVNDQNSRINRGVIGLTTHEIAHTYFPYYVGTNEKKNAWLDEGLTSYITDRANEYYDTASPLTKTFKAADRFPAARAYNNYMGSELDVPMMVPASEMNLAYRNQAYTKPATAYHFMEEFLGRELFTKAMKEFMNRWNGKHPVPTDFFFTFNDVCKQDLSWFFKPWFYDMGVADLALENASIKSNRLKVDIHKKGNLPVPVKLTVKFADGSEDVIIAHSDVWKNNSVFKIDKKYSKQIKQLVLGDDYIPDNSKSDNILDF